MAEDNSLYEIMAELLIKPDEMISQQIKTNEKLDKVADNLINVDDRLGRVENEITKLNMLSSENSRAILKLANQLEAHINLEPRVRKIGIGSI